MIACYLIMRMRPLFVNFNFISNIILITSFNSEASFSSNSRWKTETLYQLQTIARYHSWPWRNKGCDDQLAEPIQYGLLVCQLRSCLTERSELDDLHLRIILNWIKHNKQTHRDIIISVSNVRRMFDTQIVKYLSLWLFVMFNSI